MVEHQWCQLAALLAAAASSTQVSSIFYPVMRVVLMVSTRRDMLHFGRLVQQVWVSRVCIADRFRGTRGRQMTLFLLLSKLCTVLRLGAECVHDTLSHCSNTNTQTGPAENGFFC